MHIYKHFNFLVETCFLMFFLLFFSNLYSGFIVNSKPKIQAFFKDFHHAIQAPRLSV